MKSNLLLAVIFLVLIASEILGVAVVARAASDDDSDNSNSQETFYTLAMHDSYVDSGCPSFNYGDKYWLSVGLSIDEDLEEAYFRFSLEDEPHSLVKALISLNIGDYGGIDKTIHLNVILVENDWEEMTLNWTNRPAQIEIIDTIEVSEDDIYKVEITDYLKDREELSICVNMSNIIEDEDVLIDSKDFQSDAEDEKAPRIIWIKEVNIVDPLYFLVLVIVIVTILVGGSALAIFLIRRSKQLSKKSAPGATAPVVSQVPITQTHPLLQPMSSSFTPLETKVCPRCKNSFKQGVRFCEYCGQNLG